MELIAGSKPHQYRANCPFCFERTGKEDTEYKLGIDLKIKAYHCFRCEAKPSITGPLKNIYNYGNDETDYYHFFKEKEVKKYVENYDLEKISKPICPILTREAYNYLVRRGFTEAEIKSRNIRYGITFYNDYDMKINYKWKDRILFPVIERGRVKYIIGRSLVSNTDRKYINSRGGKSTVVYGYDNLTSNTCIVCEGIISAISAERSSGIPAVAILGKTISDFQVAKIAKKCDTIYLCLDGGVDPNKVARELLKADLSVKIVNLPYDKDPNEISEQQFKKCLQNAKSITVLDTFNWSKYDQRKQQAIDRR